MDEQRYLISEASRQTGVEAHVLRYWEEELELKIPRNDLGHRYYTEDHIAIFREIQELKDKGYQLKAIKDLILGGGMLEEIQVEKKGELQTEKMNRFQEVMTSIMLRALEQNNEVLSRGIGEQMGSKLAGEVSDKLVGEINYLLRQQETLEEERFRRLDESLRAIQKNGKARAEAAATQTPVVKIKKKRRGFFK